MDAFVFLLILLLPHFCMRDSFVDLVEYFVATLLLVKTCFHVLESLGQLVMELLELFDLLSISQLVF